jgi:hypothetical protein
MRLPSLKIQFILLVTVLFSAVSIAKEPQSESHQEPQQHEESFGREYIEGVDDHQKEEKKFNAGEIIMHHITDSHEWHFMTIGEKEISVPLPVILYNTEHGFSVFSYGKFEHGHKSHAGYYLDEKHHIQSLDGSTFYDFSITKNVAAMLISSLLLIWIMTTVARAYRR